MRKSVTLLGLVLLLASCRQTEEPIVEFVENKQMLPPNERWGSLFEAVQQAGVFPDGKTFVDCDPKYPTDHILSSYSVLKDEPEFHLRAFILENFDLPPDFGADYSADPSRSMSEHITSLWPVLTRQPDEHSTGSLIRLPYPYIVPGGRFREIYYWDSYFTMLGLAVDDEWEMIENMVRNFAHLIDAVGFVPNGNRTYFLSRSQPPFFASMVSLLAENKGEAIFAEFLPQLLKEYTFWMNGSDKVNAGQPAEEHVVYLGEDQLLNRYYDLSAEPRAESYREDLETAAEAGGDPAQLYRDLRAACESGWDFSSRWLADGENLITVHTTDIIPVDLNALLYKLELTIADAFRASADTDNANAYREKAARRLRSVQKYCWDEESGFFRDYDFKKGTFTPVLSMAAAYPLFYKMATDAQAAEVAQKLEADFLRAGGFTSTLSTTGQQWDEPNGWAPLQWIAYQGLQHYGLSALAVTARDRWLANNRRVYKHSTKMVEKYDVNDVQSLAGGGEYPLQDGFGWSNGVAQRFIFESQK